MSIQIRNLRNTKPNRLQPWNVQVDRKSVLGNPFFMKSETQRDEVCGKYETYFYEKIKDEDSAFAKEIRKLHQIYREHGKLNLFCWCAPKRCHAEVIKTYIEAEGAVKCNQNIKNAYRK
jgi:hypothetical protein